MDDTIRRIFRFITMDSFLKLDSLNRNEFNRISDFEGTDWRVRVIHNGGIYKRDWLKCIDNEKNGIKRKTKVKKERMHISSNDYEIISKIIEDSYVFSILPELKLGRLSNVDRILLNHLSDSVKSELLKSEFSPKSLDEVEYIDLSVFLDGVIVN